MDGEVGVDPLATTPSNGGASGKSEKTGGKSEKTGVKSEKTGKRVRSGRRGKGPPPVVDPRRPLPPTPPKLFLTSVGLAIKRLRRLQASFRASYYRKGNGGSSVSCSGGSSGSSFGLFIHPSYHLILIDPLSSSL